MFIGNPNALALMMKFAKAQKFPNVLMMGPSGHGKTTLVRMAAGNRPFVEVTGTSINDGNDMHACLKKVQPDSIFFIDEIHKLSDSIQVSLYETMKSGIYQTISGRGSNKSISSLQLPNFALCGATTHEHLLNIAFKNRFLHVTIEPYNFLDLVAMARQQLPNVDPEVPLILADHCRGVPRTLIDQYCATFRDTLNGRSATDAREMLRMLNIYPLGLTKTEVQILQILKDGVQSMSAIASKLKIEEDAVKIQHEPYLIERNFIERSRAGRKLTENGKKYLRDLQLPSLYVVPKVA